MHRLWRMRIDGCDQVMDKMGYERGLVRYTTEHSLEKRKMNAARNVAACVPLTHFDLYRYSLLDYILGGSLIGLPVCRSKLMCCGIARCRRLPKQAALKTSIVCKL